MVPPPTVSLSGLSANYCADAPSVSLTGSPAGGTFSEPGVTGSSFDPSSAGAGTHVVTYVYSDNNGCTNSSQLATTVDAVPVANAGADVTICEGASTTLTATGGGSYSWDQGLGSGASHTVSPTSTTTYTVTVGNASNCTDNDQVTVTVVPPPTVSFTGLSSSYCVDDVAANLTGTPGNGTFTGPGVSGSDFDPVAAGVGTHDVTYTFTDNNGCTGTSTVQTTVQALPQVAFSGLDSIYCSTDASVTLTGSPAGGTFSGPGVSGNVFEPAAAGNGVHSITYTFTDGNGCTNQAVSGTQVDACTGTEPAALSQLLLYPSPTSGIFYLQLPEDLPFTALEVLVWDGQGKQVFQRALEADPGQKLPFDLSAVARGLYEVEIRMAGYPAQFRKLVLQ